MSVPSKGITLLVLLGLALTLWACAPAATPTPTSTKAPAVAPTKAAEPTKPPAPTPTVPPASTPTPKPANLKLGSVQGLAYTAAYVAIDKGFLAEQGINMEVENFRTVTEMIAPLTTRQLDVIIMPLSSALLAAADRGLELKTTAAANTSTGSFEHSWILLRKDLKDSGQVKTAADLRGMKIGIPSPASLGDQTAQMVVEQGGLKPADVDITVVPFADQAAAFSNKAIAASFTTEPQVAQIIQQGLAVKWLPTSPLFGGKVQMSMVVFGPSLLNDPDLARRWMVAYLKSVRYYLKALDSAQGREDVIKILTKYTLVKDAKLYEMVDMPYFDPNGIPDKKSIEIQYKWLVEKGLYTGKKTFDDILDLSFAGYASQKLGN